MTDANRVISTLSGTVLLAIVAGSPPLAAQSLPSLPNLTGAPRAVCQECGIVDSVRDVEKKAEATGVGAIGGAVLGGLLGNQVGQGRGNTAATVGGAAGGAYAGHTVEKNMGSSRVYEVAVHFEDGRQSTFTFTELPRWRQGDKVKLINGALQQN